MKFISGSRMWANHKYGSAEGFMAIKALTIGDQKS
mgnify:CR=1 FL=1